MAEETVVLVTGASGYWGSRVAARLVAQPGWQCIGLDSQHPEEEIPGLRFVRSDLSNPLLLDLIKAEGVEVVCHMAFLETSTPSEAALELNVMGTMQLLSACVQAGVRKAVLKSSMTVYGASPSNPAFLKEEHPLNGSLRNGSTRDLLEIESFCSGLCSQSPQLALTVLRFPSIIGPTADTPMTRFLLDAWVPSLLGFDPRMQLIHEDDAVEALVHAVLSGTPGVFNVAAEGVLPLNRIRGLAGKLPFPVFHPLVYWGSTAARAAGLKRAHFAPMDPDLLRYTWVGDLSRMRNELAFAPRFTAEQTVREFAARQRSIRALSPSQIRDRGERMFGHLVGQRRTEAVSVAGPTEAEEEKSE